MKDLEAITQNIGWLGATMSFAYCSAPLASIQEVNIHLDSCVNLCELCTKGGCSCPPRGKYSDCDWTKNVGSEVSGRANKKLFVGVSLLTIEITPVGFYLP